MNYNPSINIEYGIDDNFHYIVTPNAQAITGNLLANYHSGVHSFSIIGTYGTGKSCYLMALERDLKKNTRALLKNPKVFGDVSRVECMNILGDYDSLSNLLAEKLQCGQSDDTRNIFNALSGYYDKLKKENAFLLIVIDEFGKILEHAAKHNPERELYFLQRLAEFVNVPTRKILLLTTLHQNFGSYAQKLTETQRNEWMKVKGRYKELVFSEPVEQLLYLAAEQLGGTRRKIDEPAMPVELLGWAKKMKFVSEDLDAKTVKMLYPLDAFSAMCITKAIQRYGQNERTLFSFLSAKGQNTLSDFKPALCETYNLSHVYDYLVYNFFTALAEVNADSMNWTAMRVAIERSESGVINTAYIHGAVKLVKTIGLLNLFGSSATSISKEMLLFYAENALNIPNAEKIIDLLTTHKIIRYATYKSSYILFEGTDIDIEDELYKAAGVVPMPTANVGDLAPYIHEKAAAVAEEYYRNGTPRYFEFVVKNDLEVIQPQNDIDGYIHLVFPLEDNCVEQTIRMSSACDSANIYVVFRNVDDITRHLYEIHKLQYMVENVVLEDRVAKKEVQNHINYEQILLNNAINHSLMSESDNCVWIFKGEVLPVRGYRDFNKLLTRVCHEVYNATPVLRNELFNKQKLSSAISLARVKLLDALLEKNDEADFGFAANTFPPEKTIYYTLFKCTGIHRQNEDGLYILGEPQTDLIKDMWQACEAFVQSTAEKPRKVSELVKILKKQPFKLKQGVIDFWLPIFLYVKQQDFAIYNEAGSYVMNINREFFELLQKKPGEFSIKAFNVSGIKIEFFKKYRQFLRKNDDEKLSSASFIETFKPFLQFYRSLNEYAKHTTKFDTPTTAKFRDVLGNAKDPEKAFFEDMPEALGFKDSVLYDSSEFIEQYLSLIKEAVHELNICYDKLIERIEERVIEQLSLPIDFDSYKEVLNERYQHVKKHLLTTKGRSFLERVLAPSATAKEFFEKITNVVTDKRLTQLRDKEEEYLMDNLFFLFQELDRYVSISDMADSKDEVYNFEIASNVRKISLSQTYRLAENQKGKAEDVGRAIQGLLTGDDELDVCILLRMLNEKLGKE